MKIPERDILPQIQVPEDPAAHDEGLLPRVNPGPAAKFLEEVGAFLAGQRPYSPDLETQAQALSLQQQIGILGPIARVDRPITDELLSDLAEDYNPDLGVMVERLTGDPHRRWTSALAGALFFVPTLGKGLRAVEVWAEEERDAGLLKAVRALDKASPWFWEGERPLSFGEQPAGPFWIGRLLEIHAPAGTVERRCIGRVDVPAGTPLDGVYRRLMAELWRHRVWKTGAGIAELLRKRPELLYRSVAEVVWRCSST